MGKTSTNSALNLPGRFAWMSMECPGFLTLTYIMFTLPRLSGSSFGNLPWQNQLLAGLFVLHYLYRAIAFPLMQPSMSPIHPLVWIAAMVFQLFNATVLGSWLAAYGPVSASSWDAQTPTPQFVLGVAVFYLGLTGNFYHDEVLREIRRKEARRQAAASEKGVKVDKVYRIPQAGLFRYVLFPHYLCEWIEWTGFWMACGWSCEPAMAFVVNEVAVMLPRARNGYDWYVDTFGKDKIQGKWVVVPFIY